MLVSHIMFHRFTTTDKNIVEFLSYYRVTFPKATILPKMHILEGHVIPWMKRWTIGAGLMGEQGVESIHAHLMRLEQIHQGIPNANDRRKYIFKQQVLETAPSFAALRPPSKKRLKLDTRQQYFNHALTMFCGNKIYKTTGCYNSS